EDNPVEIDDESGDVVTDEEDEGDYDVYMSDDEEAAFGGFSPRYPLQREDTQSESESRFESPMVDTIAQRVREDLLTAREAGFKVGILGSPTRARRSYISLSCRVAKLGISYEAMLAWHL